MNHVILQDVIDGSDHSATLQLTNLVEGIYKFRLRVIDRQGASDTDTATVEVRPGALRGFYVWVSVLVCDPGAQLSCSLQLTG